MAVSFTIKKKFPVSAKRLYDCWLNGELHAQMTGSDAEGKPEIGVEFSAWEGYISGKNLYLDAGKKIVQSWRTIDFNKEDDDSVVEIILNETANNCCEMQLTHTHIPENQPDYNGGWAEYYFKPMREYFKIHEE